MWQKGLGDWGQSGERIQKLRDAAESSSIRRGAMPVCRYRSCKSFAAPSQEMLDDIELLRERINTRLPVCSDWSGCRLIRSKTVNIFSFVDSGQRMAERAGP